MNLNYLVFGWAQGLAEVLPYATEFVIALIACIVLYGWVVNPRFRVHEGRFSGIEKQLAKLTEAVQSLRDTSREDMTNLTQKIEMGFQKIEFKFKEVDNRVYTLEIDATGKTTAVDKIQDTLKDAEYKFKDNDREHNGFKTRLDNLEADQKLNPKSKQA